MEQRILSGFTHVPKKTAKLKTDLIDVDLVRGKIKNKTFFIVLFCIRFYLNNLIREQFT